MKRLTILSGILVPIVALLCACDQPRARPTTMPGVPLLTFDRNGGIAGFQDRLVVGRDGEYHLERRGQQDRIGTLSGERRAQLQTWVRSLAPFTLTLEDNPGGPDNLFRQLTWTGSGKTAPSDAQQHQVVDWVSLLLGELIAGKE